MENRYSSKDVAILKGDSPDETIRTIVEVINRNAYILAEVMEKLEAEAEREQALSEEDYIELRNRFGTVVENVVSDMVNGKGERWEQPQAESEGET